MKRRLLGLGSFAIALGWAAAVGCTVETKASDVICVADQSTICTNCERPAEDSRPYVGRHTCARDGKSFGPCESCAPQIDAIDFKPDPPDEERDAGPPPVKPAPDSIDAACSGKIGVLAGKDDPADQFVYAASYEQTKFKRFSISGTPMRSPASAVQNGAGALVVYRTKGDTLVATSFAGGVWGPVSAVPGASALVGAPSLTAWDGKLKAVFREDDGYHHVATFVPGSGWQDGIELVGSSSIAPPPGISDPSAAATGAAGISGGGITVGYTDNARGIYRQEWRGANWFSKGIKATTVEAGAFRPSLIAMTSGEFDLLSLYINSEGQLRVSTRTAKESGTIWSPDTVTSEKARPADAVNGVGLDNGRALVVFLDDDAKAQYLVFDPKKTPAWTDPAPLIADENPALTATPQLVRDPCGAEATIALATDSGVVVLRFQEDEWKGPYLVDGISGVTYATVIAAP